LIILDRPGERPELDRHTAGGEPGGGAVKTGKRKKEL